MNARPFTGALIALLGSAGMPAFAAEADALAARTASYYAGGLDTPLQKIRTGAALIETCKKRFRSKCSKWHRQAADRAHFTLEYLDALTLFAPQPAATVRPAATLASYTDVVAQLDAINGEIRDAARVYDHALFTRYEATLTACPPENLAQYRESLEGLQQLDVRAFGAFSSGDDDESSRAAAALAATSAEECAAVRDFGELLMTMMSAKLEPWRRGPDAVPGPDATRSIANEFLFEVATELEVTVHPDERARFDEIAQRVHDSEPAAPKKSGFHLSW